MLKPRENRWSAKLFFVKNIMKRFLDRCYQKPGNFNVAKFFYLNFNQSTISRWDNFKKNFFLANIKTQDSGWWPSVLNAIIAILKDVIDQKLFLLWSNTANQRVKCVLSIYSQRIKFHMGNSKQIQIVTSHHS